MVASEISFKDMKELEKAHLKIIGNSAREFYEGSGYEPITILDLATGANGYTNNQIIRRLMAEGIDFDEYVLSDISPKHLKRGYESLVQQLPKKEAQKVKCVLADLTNLRKEVEKVPLYGEGTKPIKEVLKDPRYQFLKTGYDRTQRTVSFENELFSLIVGNMPYGSINSGRFDLAIPESARVLESSGYHIVSEFQVEKMNLNIERTKLAIERAKRRHIEEVRLLLDKVLNPVKVSSITYPYRTEERIPEQTLQDGDIVKKSVLTHRK